MQKATAYFADYGLKYPARKFERIDRFEAESFNQTGGSHRDEKKRQKSKISIHYKSMTGA